MLTVSEGYIWLRKEKVHLFQRSSQKRLNFCGSLILGYIAGKKNKLKISSLFQNAVSSMWKHWREECFILFGTQLISLDLKRTELKIIFLFLNIPSFLFIYLLFEVVYCLDFTFARVQRDVQHWRPEARNTYVLAVRWEAYVTELV